MRRSILVLWFFLCDLYILADSKVIGDLASSDLWNYYIKKAFCMATWKGRDFNFCEQEDEMLTCLRKTAQAEKVESRTEVKAVYQTFVDMCMAGTETNKLYMAHRGCVKDVMTDQWTIAACSATMVVKVTEFSPEQLKDPNFLRRLTCENGDELNGCLADHVMQQCGDKGTKFLHAYTDSSNRLLKQACLESGNGSGISAGNMYFSVIQVIAALAMIKWFSL